MPAIPICSPTAEGGLTLIGAGRNARNLICTFETAGIGVRALLDDHPVGAVLGHEVGLIESLEGGAVDAFLTIANPVHASAIRERSALRGCRWPRFVHPSAVASSHAETGEGCYVGPFAVITDVALGRHVHLFAHNVLGSRVTVGDFTVILPHATVGSDVRIGQRCMVAMGARIHAGITIGNDCRIGANAVVRRNMPDGTIAVSPRPPRVRGRVALGRG